MAEAAVSELECCRLALALYDAPETIAWDHIWPKLIGYAAHKRVRDTDVIVFRGSKDCADWYRDLDAVTIRYPGLGRVHLGFISGVLWHREELDAACGASVVIAGHSLGAAEACDYAGLRTAAGHPPEQVYLWGCPRPGMAQLRDVLAGVSITSRRNLDDPVTTVPWDVLAARAVLPRARANPAGGSATRVRYRAVPRASSRTVSRGRQGDHVRRRVSGSPLLIASASGHRRYSPADRAGSNADGGQRAVYFLSVVAARETCALKDPIAIERHVQPPKGLEPCEVCATVPSVAGRNAELAVFILRAARLPNSHPLIALHLVSRRSLRERLSACHCG